MDAIPVSHIEIVDGHAVIAGTKLKAKLVASMHIKGKASVEEVMEHYDVNRSEVHASLAYYYDNQNAIEQSFEEAKSYVNQYGTSSQDLLEKLRKSGKQSK